MNWHYIDSGKKPAAYNMSIDEELLSRAQAGEKTPVLRFYAWDPPAVSIGRFQKIEQAVNIDACRKYGFDIIRRVTGGRAVFHYRELTYSIASRIENHFFPPTVLGSYQVIAAALRAGLTCLGISAEIVSRGSRSAALAGINGRNPACFSSPSRYEIAVNGKKIIGSAQRRLSRAFLQHGSILMEYDPALEAELIPGGGSAGHATSIAQELGRSVGKADVVEAFQHGFAKTFDVALRQFPPTG